MARRTTCAIFLLSIPIAIATASQSKFYQACQFKILSSAQQEVVTACADKTAVHYEYVQCSKNVPACLQCSGCEDARTVSVDQYEQDSPGDTPEKDQKTVKMETEEKHRRDLGNGNSGTNYKAGLTGN